MQFVIPTNKDDMFTILDELFHYYRIERPVYTGVELKELELDRLSYSAPTQSQLEESAKLLVGPVQTREISERRSLINQEITKLTLEKSSIQASFDQLIEKTESLYADSREKLEQQAIKNGLITSGMYMEKFAQMEVEKNDKIIEIASQKANAIKEIDAKLEVQNQLLNDCASYFFDAHESDVKKKIEELRQEALKIEREVIKYNNGIDEKEQRYKNTIAQINANLELKFLTVSTGEYTQDQLVEMGYYEDVMKCVCGYYNSLPALTAYQDFSNDTRLPIYLDHYYENILYMYQSKAGL